MTTASSRPSPSIPTITILSTWARLREACGGAATPARPGRRSSTSSLARHRRARRHRHRPQRHQHHLRRHQRARRQRRARHDRSAHGRPLQVEGRRRELDRARLGLPGRQHRQRHPVQQPDDQRHPRRSRQQQRRLPRLDQRRVHLVRRRPELDAGDRHQRGHPLAGAGPLDPGERADPPRRRLRRRRLPLQRMAGARSPRRSARPRPSCSTALGGKSFTRVVVALAPPTSPRQRQRRAGDLCHHGGGLRQPRTTRSGVFISTDQGSTWTQADRDRHLRHHLWRLRPRYGGGSRLTRGRDYRHDLFRLPRPVPSPPTPARTSPGSASGTPTRTPGRWFRSPAAAARSSIAAATAASSPTPAARGRGLNKNGLQTGLFYNLAIKPDATASVTVGALQDNQLQTTKGATSPAWNATFGGDGWDVAYDGAPRRCSTAPSGGPATSIFFSTDDGATLPRSEQRHSSVDRGGHRRPQQRLPPESARGRPQRSGHPLCERRSEPVAAPGRRDVAHHRLPRQHRQRRRRADQRQQCRHCGGQARSGSRPTRSPRRSVRRPASPSPTSPGTCPAATSRGRCSIPIDPTVIYAVINGFGGGAAQNVFKTTVSAGLVDQHLSRPRSALRRDRGRRDDHADHALRGHRFRRHPLGRRRRVVVRARRHPLPARFRFSISPSTRRPAFCAPPPTAAACSSSRRRPGRPSRSASRTVSPSARSARDRNT